MDVSPSHLAATLARHAEAGRYWIAYSGGMDSHVLLHLGAELKRRQIGFDFSAVHVHHGLLTDAEAWSAHCAEVCRALDLPFTLLRVDATPERGQSREEAARNARYRAIESLMAPGDVLLTAQHQEDQAETMLLQLLRGAGLDGLAGMPQRAAFGGGWLLRPLLEFARASLHAYAVTHGLRWIEDPSNRDIAYDRSFLRQQVFPVLGRRWPAASSALSRSAGHCAEALALQNRLGRDLFLAVRSPARNTLRISQLKLLDEAGQRLVLREWLRSSGYRMPSARVLQRVLVEAIPARPDRMPRVAWREGEIRRYRDELHLRRPAVPFDASAVIAWNGETPLELPSHNGILRAVEERGAGIVPEIWRRGRISVRYRRGGEKCRLPGRAGSRLLKKLLQETAAVPPWLRQRIPLIYIDDRLAAAANLWVFEPFAGPPEASNVRISWHLAEWTDAGAGG
jgi:tRNA(Ile)-lysidine synthase